VLQYLVTSKVRRRLLSLLWGEKQRGSVTELAELAGVAFAGVHAEVKAMQRLELVVVQREGGKDVYAANFEHPEADVLRSLVASEARPVSPKRSADESLRRELVALGAPLRGVKPLAVSPSRQMAVLFDGAQLARRDSTVARVLPLCFWNLREALDVGKLEAHAFRAEDKHTLGFFLELTGILSGDRYWVGLADRFRDRRITSLRDFFFTGLVDVARDFTLAAKWGFRMNMDLDSFRSLFTKFIS